MTAVLPSTDPSAHSPRRLSDKTAAAVASAAAGGLAVTAGFAPVGAELRIAAGAWAALVLVAAVGGVLRRFPGARGLAILAWGAVAGSFGVGYVLYQAGYVWADWPPPVRGTLWLAVALGLYLTLAGPRLAPIQAALVVISVVGGAALISRLAPQTADQIRLAAWELGDVHRPIERFERGRAIPHPEIGFDYEPGTIWKTYYPDNPAAAFRGEPLGWDLTPHGESTARLEYPGGAQGPVRIVVDRVAGSNRSQVELSWSEFGIEAGATYELRLRARASTTFSLGCYVGAAAPPFDLAAEFVEVPLGSTWRKLRLKLVATRTEPRARLVLQLGYPGQTVELADVGLWRDGQPVPRHNGPDDARTPHVVTYEMNSLGFRDRDYAIPRPPGTLRIVCLGDSLGFGYGVAVDEVVSERLEASLTARAVAAGWQTPIEVVNACRCGYGPRDERRSFELVSSKYEPQLVVLLASPTDDANFADDVARGIIAANPRHGPVAAPAPNDAELPGMEGAMAEIRLLDQACRERGARLEVMIFRHLVFDHSARRSAGELAHRLAETDIPWFDLGTLPELVAHKRIVTVHPTDPHPSDVVHRLAAAELEKRLWPAVEQIRAELAP